MDSVGDLSRILPWDFGKYFLGFVQEFSKKILEDSSWNLFTCFFRNFSRYQRQRILSGIFRKFLQRLLQKILHVEITEGTLSGIPFKFPWNVLFFPTFFLRISWFSCRNFSTGFPPNFSKRSSRVSLKHAVLAKISLQFARIPA